VRRQRLLIVAQLTPDAGFGSLMMMRMAQLSGLALLY
jgi:hypothetical protein